jgi:hypothetical protein
MRNALRLAEPVKIIWDGKNTDKENGFHTSHCIFSGSIFNGITVPAKSPVIV